MSPEEVRDALSDLAVRRAMTVAEYDRARGRLREHQDEIARLARAGRDSGLTIVEIARLAGVTRATVYELLR